MTPPCRAGGPFDPEKPWLGTGDRRSSRRNEQATAVAAAEGFAQLYCVQKRSALKRGRK